MPRQAMSSSPCRPLAAPQQEADGSFANPAPLPNGKADSIWLCTGTAGDCTDPTTDPNSHFKRYKTVNGVAVDENGRALVLTFNAGNWATGQRVYVYAPDDPRSEGDRIVVVQHSVISTDSSFDAALVRNVEVKVYDNDTPGVFVTEIEKSAVCPGVLCVQDDRTVVVEGSNDPAVAGAYTGTDDDILIQLAKRPDVGQIVVVKLSMDVDSQKAISLLEIKANVLDPSRLIQHADLDGGTYYTIDFTDLNWETPVRVRVIARDDPVREDPQTAVINYTCDTTANSVCGKFDALTNGAATFQFPNLRSGPGRTAITVIDNDTAGLVVRESGVDTVVVKCGNAACSTTGGTDDYWIRLTKRPENPNDPTHLAVTTVQVAVLTDGLVDVKSINGTPINYASLTDPLLQKIGGDVPSRLFLGNLTFGIGAGGRLTLTRANGSETGSFIDEGFAKDQLVQVSGYSEKFHVYSVTDTVLTLLETTPAWSPVTTTDMTTAISRLTSAGLFVGEANIEIDSSTPGCATAPFCRRLVRLAPDGTSLTDTDLSGWLADGFLEGQRVLICDSSATGDSDAAHCGRFKIAIIRGDNKSFDNKIELTSENAFPAGWITAWTNGSKLKFTVTRLAAVATFDDGNLSVALNWYSEQHIVLVADLAFNLPIVRQGVKIFPVSTHILSKLQGPLAVEGGVTGADRSLSLGVKLPGEKDGPLFAIGPQSPESKQIDVLNIFNDGSQQDRSGSMTSTTIKGLGLAKDLDFGPNYSNDNPQKFGEPSVFPGGISFGSVQFVDGAFQTDGGKSTIEVVNLMLGQGNDRFQVNGTLNPDDAVKLVGSIIVTVRAAGALGGTDPGGIDVTRSQPFDWKAQGFLSGAPVHISGLPQTWKVVGFSDPFTGDTTDNTVMHLILVSGSAPTAPLQTTATNVVGAVTTNGSAFGGSLTRAGGSWIDDGFEVGQQVRIGVNGPWQVLAVSAATLLLGNGPALSDSVGPASVTLIRVTPALRTTIADDSPVTDTIAVTIESNDADPALSDGGTVARATGTWADSGFIVGQWVMIDGIAGTGWRLLDITNSGKTLTLGRGSPLPSSASTVRTVFVPGPHGGLTVIHGGGNLPMSLAFDNTVLSNTVTVGLNSVTRNDGLAWADDGYSQYFANGLPQHIQVGAAGQTRTISGFGNAPCPLLADPFPGCGVGSVMNFTIGEPVSTAPLSGQKTLVYVAEAKRSQQSGSMNISVDDIDGPGGPAAPTSTLTCSACDFVDAGFKVGMQVTVSGSMTTVTSGGTSILDVGLPGSYTIASVTNTTITFANVALTPTLTGLNAPNGAPVPLRVTGYNPLLHETDPTVYGTGTLGMRIGGDTITVGIAKTGAFTFGTDSVSGAAWTALGFAVGQTVQITGESLPRTIKTITGTTMTFEAIAGSPLTTGPRSATIALAGSLAGSEFAARRVRRHVAGRRLVQRPPVRQPRLRVRTQAVRSVHEDPRRPERGRRVDLPARRPVHIRR